MIEERRRLLSRAYGDAGAFRRYWADELAAEGRALIARLDLRDAGRVLDLGTGIGLNVPTLHEAAANATVVAADYVEAMIRAAPSTAARICMDAAALGFADDSFDAVLMAFMLFHVPDPPATLAQVRRILRPGGHLAVGTLAASEHDYEPDRIWQAELDAHGADPLPETIARHELMNTRERLRRLLEDAGFTQIETEAALFEDPISDLEEFLVRRTTIGVSSVRFSTLSPTAQESCVAAARAKLSDVPSEEFVSPEPVIFAWARRSVRNSRAPAVNEP